MTHFPQLKLKFGKFPLIYSLILLPSVKKYWRFLSSIYQEGKSKGHETTLETNSFNLDGPYYLNLPLFILPYCFSLVFLFLFVTLFLFHCPLLLFFNCHRKDKVEMLLVQFSAFFGRKVLRKS